MSNHGFPDDLTILSQPETWAPLKFDIMATKNNKMRVVKNVANNAWAGLCWCGNALKSVGQGIIIAIVLIAMFILVYNPVMFLFWSIICPKKAAKMLYEADLEWYSEFCIALNCWMIALYPFCMKKHFMALREIKYYSVKEQCKYYRWTERRADVIRQMSDKAVQKLWKENYFDDRVQIASAGVKLSAEQFDYLVRTGQTTQVLAYVRRWTPNADMVRVLIKEGEIQLLVFVVKSYGLSAEVVNEVFASEDEKLIAAVKEALVVYSHRQTVLNTQRSDEGGRKEWMAFCSSVESGKIRSFAQKAMNGWQYDAFHKAGHALDTEAVEFFFAKGDVPMCTRIFQYEKDNGRVSEKADALVAANPKLTAALLQVMSEQKKA